MELREYHPTEGSLVCSWLAEETAFEYWSAGQLGPFPLTAKQLTGFYAKQQGVVLMAEENSRPVGQLLFQKVSPTQVHLGFVVVDPECRGKGLGKRLIQLALEQAATLGATEVTIGVFAENLAARKCYESLGFVQQGQTTRPLRGTAQPYLELNYLLT